MNTLSAARTLPPLDVRRKRIDEAIARRIRVVGLDVDGVLTDGGIYLGATVEENARGFEFKRYDTQDGLGVHLMRMVGIEVVIITGRVSGSVAMRGAELRISRVIQDPKARKLHALNVFMSEYGCSAEEVAFIGDDLPDLPVLRTVGLPVAVKNAAQEVKQASLLVLDTAGGYGAVREFAEALLVARGEWTDTVERYVAEKCKDDTGGSNA